MDFSAIFQLRTKKFWWMDVIFYFVMSLLVATVLCYFVFSIKNGMIEKEITAKTSQLQTVGTLEQKQHETAVLTYQKKINSFTTLFKGHQFASNVFAFMQAETMPNVWFSQFSLDEKSNAVQLSGEADDVDSFSRQVVLLEGNKYIKSLGTFNSSLGQSARENFNLSLVMDPSIFSYLSTTAIASVNSPVLAAAPAAVTIPAAAAPSATPAATAAPISATSPTQPVATATTPAGQAVTPTTSTTQVPVATSSPLPGQKLITSFHLLLTPEVTGTVSEINNTVLLKVPYGTNVKNLTPEIVVSSGATVVPASLVPQDFTSPVTYQVIASDGTSQNYVVTVMVAPAPAKSSGQPLSLILIIEIVAGLAVIIGVIIFLFIWFKNKRKV